MSILEPSTPDVSLLIANFSGNAVVRLSVVTLEGRRDGHNERVESLSLDESIYSSILSSQRPRGGS